MRDRFHVEYRFSKIDIRIDHLFEPWGLVTDTNSDNPRAARTQFLDDTPNQPLYPQKTIEYHGTGYWEQTYVGRDHGDMGSDAEVEEDLINVARSANVLVAG